MGFYGHHSIETREKIGNRMKEYCKQKYSNIDTSELFIICKFCGNKKFFSIKNRFKIKEQIFCSKSCLAKSRKGIPHRKMGQYSLKRRLSLSKGWEQNSPKYKHISKEWLIENYIHKKLGTPKCAELFGCSYETIYRRLKKFNIPIRNNSECEKAELHHLWKGGISKEPYPFNFDKELKKHVKERDNFKCQICDVPELECERTFCIHHIDYNKKNLSEVNLISLCSNCHSKTNFNRKYWEKYFTELMIKKMIGV